MDSRIRVAGVLAAASGALLVVALLLDWWGYPSAFDDPAELPRAAEFTAEQVAERGQDPDADAYAFFGFRDLLWLAAGLTGFAFGLYVLAVPRARTPAAAATGILALAAVILIAATLISPPDYADLAPGKPFDFGVELPLSREAGGFVALVAAAGVMVASGLALQTLGGFSRRR